MAFTEFENLLKESMGVEAASIGASTIARAVRERQRACSLDDLGAYWTHLSGSAAELQSLIEAVVVPETWFFRDRRVFAALGGIVRHEWYHANTPGVLRLLSLPCSTGEEPYSMAMALLDAGVPAHRFHIDAVDISERGLAHARRGVYGKGSFRGQSLDFRDRHFEATAAGHRIGKAVRSQVEFQQGNLFSPTFLPGTEVYDVIFCRNVLIYFDRRMQERAIGVLSRLLRSSGWLFVGSSETGALRQYGFAQVKVPMAFAFRKAKAVASQSKPIALPSHIQPRTQGRPATLTVATSTKTQASRIATGLVPPHTNAEASVGAGLDEATELANQGRLGEAAVRCEGYLREHGPSAEAFHLLGLVRDAGGDQAEAATCYRKALYLDPSHHEALIHLALLMERLDKKTEAKVLRARAERLHQRSG